MAKKNHKTSKADDEELLLQLKTLSVSNKDREDIYTKLVHADSYKNNIIKNVINYIPFIMSYNQTTKQDELYLNSDYFTPLKDDNGKAITLWNGAYSKYTGYEELSLNNYDSTDMSLFEEDNTISEIINQKMIAFSKGTLIPKINEDSSIYKKSDDTTKELLASFIEKAIELLQDFDLKEIIESTKWYPYKGVAFIPLSYNEGTDTSNLKPNNRKVIITPFNSDFDGNSNSMSEAEYVIVTERITYNTFKKRVMFGEYSAITVEKDKEDIDDFITSFWNAKSSYTFVSKNFVEQALNRTTSLRNDIMKGVKTSDRNSDSLNLIGIIDYLFIKDWNGKLIVNTFLNGDKIGETRLDSAIDTFPIVLFSEARDIDNNLNFSGNVGFKLLSSQNSILKLNSLKKAATVDMAPIVTAHFITDENQKETIKDITTISTADNTITSVYIGVKNTAQASNESKVLIGAQIYPVYLNEIDKLITTTINIMKVKAGITDFLEGTASHSFESGAGVDAMKIAGLESDLDIIDSLKNSLVKLATMEAFFDLINLENSSNLEDVKKVSFISGSYRTSLSTALKGYSDIMNFDFETNYQKQFSLSLLQSVMLPMAAQSGSFDIILKLLTLEDVPITNNMREMLNTMEQELKQRAEQSNGQQNDGQEVQPKKPSPKKPSPKKPSPKK